MLRGKEDSGQKSTCNYKTTILEEETSIRFVRRSSSRTSHTTTTSDRKDASCLPLHTTKQMATIKATATTEETNQLMGFQNPSVINIVVHC